MVFKACLKKEIYEEIRTKRFLRYCLFACGMVVLALLIIGMMNMVANIQVSGEEGADMFNTLKEMFAPNYSNFCMFFASFIMTYFSIIYVIMLMNSIGKEISQNKWILPISAGILPESMISAKLIVKTLSIICAELIAILIHFIVLVCFFKPVAGFGIGMVLLCYLGIILNTIFMATITLTINAITKKGWPSALVSLSILIIGSTILESIVIKGKMLITYTPLLFSEIAVNPTVSLNVTQWLVSFATYFIVLAGLIVWAIFSNKLKPNKN